MARTTDLMLREEILEKCATAAIRYGMRDLTLTTLSKRIDISSRMLIYHFGSKEELATETSRKVQDILRSRLDQALKISSSNSVKDAVLKLWKHGISPGMEDYFKGFFNLYTEGLLDRRRHATFIASSVDGWLEWARAAMKDYKPVPTEEDLTVILSMLRGAFLDYWATRDFKRTSKSIEHFLRCYEFGVISKN